MKNRKSGFLLFLVGLIIFFLFEGSNLALLGGALIVAGLGMVLRPPKDRELTIYENPRTTENLRHWGYYETVHFSRSRRNKQNRQFRVVLKTATGEDYAFLMPEIPPRKFFWINGKPITPERAKEKFKKLKPKK